MPVRQRTAWRLPGILDVGMNLLHFDQEGWGSVFGAEVSCQLRILLSIPRHLPKSYKPSSTVSFSGIELPMLWSFMC